VKNLRKFPQMRFARLSLLWSPRYSQVKALRHHFWDRLIPNCTRS
jgi:hypothetical protein